MLRQECAKGKSWRYGLGVSFEDHSLYLASIGHEPEQRSDGSWVGFDAAKQDPLADEDHPFASLPRPVSTVDAAGVTLQQGYPGIDVGRPR